MTRIALFTTVQYVPLRILSSAVLLMLVSLLTAGGADRSATGGGSAGSPALASVALEANPNPAVANKEVTLKIQVADSNGNPVSQATVTVTAEHTGMSMGKFTVDARESGNGEYAARMTPTMAGQWKLVVAARAGGTTKKASDELPVR